MHKENKSIANSTLGFLTRMKVGQSAVFVSIKLHRRVQVTCVPLLYLLRKCTNIRTTVSMTGFNVYVNFTSLYLEMFPLEGIPKDQDVKERHFPKEE